MGSKELTTAGIYLTDDLL